ncbi:DUF3558 domain-containing protein [Streptomyces sp. NPDC057757]|uniref:DUF3558 domain-containing protein n=1 Tax=Streptomyces sp. NPDC057757 TaxID=3346241 RepID=UPI003686BAFE
MLVAAGCSSDSDSGSGSGAAAGDKDSSSGASPDAQASESASANAVQVAAYETLPESCSVLSKKTLGELVPEAGKSGKKGTTGEVSSRGNCYWTSLDSNGVKGSQYRWLNVALLRFEADGRGAGEDQAHAYFEKQVGGAKAVSGAKNTKSAPVSGTGDEATAVSYDLKKKEGAFKQQTVVARVENVVVTVDYNGAGLAGEKTPSAATLLKSAQKAAKEAVASVTAANESGGAGSSASPSKSASKSPSKSASKSASSSASPSESATKS